jgi:hypothetical protein
MEGQKTKLYMRTCRPSEAPSDSNEAVPQPRTRKPFGLWMTGTESIGFINGRPTVMVRLQDGAFEPLSELVVTEVVERRKLEKSNSL